MATPPSTTKQGYEIQFGTNHMGHALLTKLLMPKLLETAKEPGSDVRIVNLSSAGHQMPPSGGLVLKDVKTDMASNLTWVRYGQSKLANILFTRELARRYPTIKSMALHPGGINTGLSQPFQDAHPWLSWLDRPIRMLLTSVQDGALTQLFAATSPKAKSGQYYVPVAKESSGSTYSQDPKLAAELWEWTEAELTRLGYNDKNE
jgi:NAD(P)-dependent dehydrogenase (short-subunit alcohol dehydrogenase family)